MPRTRPLSVLVLLPLLLAACSSGPGSPGAATPSPSSGAGETAAVRPSNPIAVSLPPGYRIETLAEGLEEPAALAALPDGRLLIAEQVLGRVRVFQDGRLLEEPWFELAVHTQTEGFAVQELGLVSVAADPRFEENRYVFIYYTEVRDGAQRTVLARLRDVDGRGADLAELLSIDLAPEARHIAGGIAFDGDALLVGVGDHEEPELAQDLASLAGKVLRVDGDGNALDDNPFAGRPDADPRVYAYGLRNPFGIAVDPAGGRAFITENRDVAGDAVYQLEPGADYGWPEHEIALRTPLIIYDRPMGVAGAAFYTGGALPELAGDLFFCSYHSGGALHWSETEELEGFDMLRRDRTVAPCSSGVTQGADGLLYFLDFVGGRLLRISR